MKNLPAPTYNDAQALKVISKNSRLGSYPYLSDCFDKIIARYVAYRLVNGNPWLVTPLGLQNPLKKNLITHYASPPPGLEHLETIRNDSSPDVCPMCGSLKTGTLDHVLPKTDYPEFAVYAQNLVPACDCNTLRRADYKGTVPAQRVLHPYFDLCLQQRLVHAIFIGHLEHPKISLRVCCGNIPDVEAVKFHIENVVLKTRILKFLDAKWATLIRTPNSILINIGNDFVDEQFVRQEVNRMLVFSDTQHGTPNNWLSIFYAGVLETAGVTNWLVTRINGLNDGSIVPT